MGWAKTHKKVRYELTLSDAPHVTFAEFGDALGGATLEFGGPYGHPQLIDLIASRYGVEPGCVLPTSGTSLANAIAMGVAMRRGHRVLMEHPVYHPLLRVCELFGLEVTGIARLADWTWKLDLDALRHELSQGDVACVFLTNLHNPSGQYLDRSSLVEIAEQCEELGVLLIIDEVYLDGRCIVNRKRPWTIGALTGNVLATSSLTKVYGLSGLRAGWLIASLPLMEEAKEVVDALNVCDSPITSHLALRAFERMENLEQRYQAVHASGQSVFREWVKAEPRIEAYPNAGAIFEWIKLPANVTGFALNELLTSEFETQVTPGEFFQSPDHVRLTTALNEADMRVALQRISQALTRLQAKPAD